MDDAEAEMYKRRWCEVRERFRRAEITGTREEFDRDLEIRDKDQAAPQENGHRGGRGCFLLQHGIKAVVNVLSNEKRMKAAAFDI
jgi:hypothetical protein